MSSNQEAQFADLPHPIGVNSAFITDHPVFLVLTEHALSFSGDDFTVDTLGLHGPNDPQRPFVQCSGKVASLSGRKTFASVQTGHVLFTLRKSHFSFPRSWYLEGPGGERFLELEGRFAFGKAKLDARFTSTVGTSAGKPVVLEVRGQFFDRSADILWNGQPVARVRRDFLEMRDIFFNKQTYGVHVAAGVDLALIAAIVVGLDEQRNEK